MFRVSRFDDIEKFSVLNSAVPVPLTIKLQSGTKEFYQLNELTKNNAFHRAGNSITKAVKKSGKKTVRKREGE